MGLIDFLQGPSNPGVKSYRGPGLSPMIAGCSHDYVVCLWKLKHGIDVTTTSSCVSWVSFVCVVGELARRVGHQEVTDPLRRIKLSMCLAVWAARLAVPQGIHNFQVCASLSTPLLALTRRWLSEKRKHRDPPLIIRRETTPAQPKVAIIPC